MNTPESRTLLRVNTANEHGADVISQLPIPWCTTHNTTMIEAEPSCDNPWSGDPCTISQGGPDHKWWRDV